jgi:hypothetical protein
MLSTVPDQASFWLRETKSPTSRATRTPLVIYVLWHPSFVEGPQLAREIAEWCGSTASDIRAVGMGIPVYFRSAPWTADCALLEEDVPPTGAIGDTLDAQRSRALDVWRRPIELDEATHNVFVPLVDENMVDDPSWRRDLIDLANRHKATRERCEKPVPCVHVAPIQISSSWARLPTVVSGIQALFMRRWNDPEPKTPDERAARLEIWRIRIRRLLTQALVRLLREVGTTRMPTEVFLSHAKADQERGPGVAERLRDKAAGYGQIDVFYDENDLPSGIDWANQLNVAAQEGAGFIAVLSDAYASRFWCRREAQLARTPVPATNLSLPAKNYVWRVRPTVVAITMQGKWSRLVGDVSAVPAIRWSDADEFAAQVLDQLFREALLGEFQVQYAALLHERLSNIETTEPPLPLAYMTWTMDSTTLLRLYRDVRARMAGGGIVVYPGHGFLPTEEAELTAALGEQIQFVPFEQFSDAVHEKPKTWSDVVERVRPKPLEPQVPMSQRPLVALSAGDSDDLARLGYDATPEGGSAHVDIAVLRVCRTLLQGEARLAYGGILRPGPSFSALLQDIVVAMATTNQDPRSVPALADPETPLEAWVAKPLEKAYPVDIRAMLVGLCRYYFVGDAPPPDADADATAVAVARSLSVMRVAVAERTRMQVALAGKRYGSSGIMPGVAEEILCSWEREQGVRVLLLGDFGGISREIVRYILRRTDELPAPLTLEGQLAHNDPKLVRLMNDSDMRKEAETRYEALARCLASLRAAADQDPKTRLPRLGLTVEQWRKAMTTQSIGFIRRLIRDDVLPWLHAGP